jgi:hypothetical protein
VTSVVAVVVAAAVLTGCSQSAEKVSRVPQTSAPDGRTTPSTSTTTTTRPPVPPTTAAVGTAVQLREQLMTQGLCLTEVELTVEFEIVPITSAVQCEDGYDIYVFPSLAARDQALDLISQSLCFLPFYLAVSDSWIVYPKPATAFRSGKIIDVLGGVVQEVPCRYVPPTSAPEPLPPETRTPGTRF